MESLLALVVGVLFTAGIYMMLRRSLVKLVIGLALISHAVHLLIFTAGRPTPGTTPIVPVNGTDAAVPLADPVPQALILTAIVISFGVQAFAVILIKRSYETIGTDDLDRMLGTEQEDA